MTLSHILSAAALTAARIGGGVVSPGPAVTLFARSGKSVAPTVSGCIAAGDVLRLRRCSQLAGGFGSRHFSQFGAVAGSSGPRADAIHGTGFVLGPTPQTPGALTECATSETNAGGIQ